MKRNVVLYGDSLAVLRELPDACVQTCVTSPPYYGLRDYGTPGQIGLEATPAEYVDRLVEVFREVRRVLREDGTLWINLGDSYANDSKWGGSTGGKHVESLHGNTGIGRAKRNTGFKAKELMMIPARAAIALQDDGWYLRSDIIWAKGNPMPESVKDRPTRSHEYLFLLAKNERYFYDADSVREPAANVGPTIGLVRAQDNAATSARRADGSRLTSGTGNRTLESGAVPSYGAPETGRNRRSVWTINPRPYKGAHFAVFPPELPELCIRAGSRPGDLVLDPFAGSGTTLEVAKNLDRDFIGIELNDGYRTLIEGRIEPAMDNASQRDAFRLMMEMDQD